jgi:hypothetical protein
MRKPFRFLMGVFLLGASLPHVATCAADYAGTCADPELLEEGDFTIYSVSNSVSVEEDLFYLMDSSIVVNDQHVVFRYQRDGWNYEASYERGEWR